MAELDLETGAGGEQDKPKRKPGRPSNAEKATDLRKDLRETLIELAAIAKRPEREEVADLGDVLRRDADKIADVAVAWADRIEWVEKALRKVVGKSGPVFAIRAFGPTMRTLAASAVERREQLLDRFGHDEELDEEDGVYPLHPPGPDQA